MNRLMGNVIYFQRIYFTIFNVFLCVSILHFYFTLSSFNDNSIKNLQNLMLFFSRGFLFLLWCVVGCVVVVSVICATDDGVMCNQKLQNDGCLSKPLFVSFLGHSAIVFIILNADIDDLDKCIIFGGT